MFRKVVDGKVTLIVCAHVDDVAVTSKDKKAFDVFHAQLKEDFSVNDMEDLSWYLGCAVERDKIQSVTKMMQILSVGSLVDRFNIHYETNLQTPASVEFDLAPKRIHEKGGD